MMRKYIPIFCALLLIGAAASCRREIHSVPDSCFSYEEESEEDKEKITVPSGMHIEHVVVERRSPGYNGQTGALVRISFDRVVNPTPAMDDSVNRYVADFIDKNLSSYGKGSGQPLEAWADQYLAAYEAYCHNWTGDGPPPAWDLQMDCRIRNPYDHLVSVECNMGGFAGYRHPDYSSVYHQYVINRVTPENRVRLFSNPDYINRITAHLFREMPVSSARMGTPDPQFPFGPLAWRQNFTFRNDTIVFAFPHYQEAPVRMGESGIGMQIEGLEQYAERINEAPFVNFLPKESIVGIIQRRDCRA